MKNKKVAAEAPDILAVVWVFQNIRYFISTASSVQLGKHVIRNRWRQLTDIESDDPAVRVRILVEQPRVCEAYYSTCGAIDQINRCRQANLKIERVHGT